MRFDNTTKRKSLRGTTDEEGLLQNSHNEGLFRSLQLMLKITEHFLVKHIVSRALSGKDDCAHLLYTISR